MYEMGILAKIDHTLQMHTIIHTKPPTANYRQLQFLCRLFVCTVPSVGEKDMIGRLQLNRFGIVFNGNFVVLVAKRRVSKSI